MANADTDTDRLVFGYINLGIHSCSRKFCRLAVPAHRCYLNNVQKFLLCVKWIFISFN